MQANQDKSKTVPAASTNQHGFSYGLLWFLHLSVNFALLGAALVLGFVAFFQSLEILLTLGASLILQSMGDSVRAKYALVTLRNVWLLVGGVVFLVVIIYCINVFFKRWRDIGIHRAYIILLMAEALIIVLARVLT